MEDKEFWEKKAQRKRSGNVIGGLVLLGIGGVLLARQFGFYFPHWVFTWPVWLIVIGLFVGARHNFRDFGWLIMVGIGSIFLLDDLWPDIPVRQYIWPVIIIGVGLIMILVPRAQRPWHWGRHRNPPPFNEPGNTIKTAAGDNVYTESGEDALDIVSIFGGAKKMVYSKNFKGGEIVCVFGGADINLTQADFTGPITIELVQIFGGSKFIVPSHWQIRTETAVIFGGVDDKRIPPQPAYDPNKVLILKGTTLFGGIEIKSF
ncbi:MAG: cell wall-active antibiotics response protein [Bacteroidota bacterium]|nr:cell wall-active antibiotics response protein [Bacteroidota bacterium]